MERKQSRRFLESVEENLLSTGEGVMGNAVISGHLGHSNHEIMEFSVLGEVRRGTSRTATLDLCQADFGLLRTLTGRVPWESVLKGKVVQEG